MLAKLKDDLSYFSQNKQTNKEKSMMRPGMDCDINMTQKQAHLYHP